MMRTIALGLIAYTSFAIWSTMAVEAVQPPKPEISTSVSQCKVCHSFDSRNPDSLRDYLKVGSDKYIKLDESLTWERQDPHSVPFAKLLDSDAGKKMLKSEKYRNALTNDSCRTCHTIDTKRETDRFVGTEALGIGCTACHGLPSTWQTKHFDMPDGKTIPWRMKSPEEKEKDGMRNLRDPMTKANLCASCHVGDPDQGKVVTHEMYVAGHPPLPPFELLTFMNDEPRHWGTPFDEKLSFFHSPDSDTEKNFSFRKVEGEAGYAARHLAAGAIAAVQGEASLLITESQKAMKSQPPTGLDYARFDCYACHHDLKLPSDRQKRGYDGPPGRPPVKAWVGALMGTVSPVIPGNANDGFAARWKAVQEATYAKPYADPMQMMEAATKLKEWADGMKVILDGDANWTKADGEKLHANLLKAAQAEKWLGDPEAVMALVWAYRGMHKPLTGEELKTDEWAKVIPIHLRMKHSKNNMPVTVGDIWTERMRGFNKFDSAEFLKLFPEKAK